MRDGTRKERSNREKEIGPFWAVCNTRSGTLGEDGWGERAIRARGVPVFATGIAADRSKETATTKRVFWSL